MIKGLAAGGAERLLLSFATIADRQLFRYETAYILPSLRDMVADLDAIGVPATCIGADNHLDLRWLGRLRRRLLTDPVDVVHLHLPYVGVFVALLVRTIPASRRPRLVYTQHNMWQGVAVAERALLRWAIPRFDAVVAVSDIVRLSMPATLQRHTRVIVHGVLVDAARAERAHRASIRAELGVRDDDILITSVANLRRGKGHEILLQAARVLVDEGLPVRFAIVGFGEQEAEIRALRDELGLDGTVDLLGYRADAIRVLAASDLFALASLQEGFPVSVMEALAVGVPVVATAVGGVSQAVTSGVQGLVVPAGSAAALADAMRDLATDPDARRRMAGAALERGRAFDMGIAVRQVESIYLDLMGAP